MHRINLLPPSQKQKNKLEIIRGAFGSGVTTIRTGIQNSVEYLLPTKDSSEQIIKNNLRYLLRQTELREKIDVFTTLTNDQQKELLTKYISSKNLSLIDLLFITLLRNREESHEFLLNQAQVKLREIKKTYPNGSKEEGYQALLRLETTIQELTTANSTLLNDLQKIKLPSAPAPTAPAPAPTALTSPTAPTPTPTALPSVFLEKIRAQAFKNPSKLETATNPSGFDLQVRAPIASLRAYFDGKAKERKLSAMLSGKPKLLFAIEQLAFRLALDKSTDKNAIIKQIISEIQLPEHEQYILNLLLTANTKEDLALANNLCTNLFKKINEPCLSSFLSIINQFNNKLALTIDGKIDSIDLALYQIIETLHLAAPAQREAILTNLLINLADANINLSAIERLDENQENQLQAQIKNLFLTNPTDFTPPSKIFNNYDLPTKIRNLRRELAVDHTKTKLIESIEAKADQTRRQQTFQQRLNQAKNDTTKQTKLATELTLYEALMARDQRLPTTNLSANAELYNRAIAKLFPHFADPELGTNNIESVNQITNQITNIYPSQFTPYINELQQIYFELALDVNDSSELTLTSQKKAILGAARQFINIQQTNQTTYNTLITSTLNAQGLINPESTGFKAILAQFQKKHPQLTSQNLVDLITALQIPADLQNNKRSFKKLPAIIKDIPQITYALKHITAEESEAQKSTAIKLEIDTNANANEQPNTDAFNSWRKTLFSNELSTDRHNNIFGTKGLPVQPKLIAIAIKDQLGNAQFNHLAQIHPWLLTYKNTQFDQKEFTTNPSKIRGIGSWLSRNIFNRSHQKYVGEELKKVQSYQTYYEQNLKPSLDKAFGQLSADKKTELLLAHFTELGNVVQDPYVAWANRFSDQELVEQLSTTFQTLQNLAGISGKLEAAETILATTSIIKNIPIVGSFIGPLFTAATATGNTTIVGKQKTPWFSKIKPLSIAAADATLELGANLLRPADSEKHPVRNSLSHIFQGGVDHLLQHNTTQVAELKRLYQALTTIAEFRGISIPQAHIDAVNGINIPTYGDRLAQFVSAGLVDDVKSLQDAGGFFMKKAGKTLEATLLAIANANTGKPYRPESPLINTIRGIITEKAA